MMMQPTQQPPYHYAQQHHQPQHQQLHHLHQQHQAHLQQQTQQTQHLQHFQQQQPSHQQQHIGYHHDHQPRPQHLNQNYNDNIVYQHVQQSPQLLHHEAMVYQNDQPPPPQQQHLDDNSALRIMHDDKMAVQMQLQQSVTDEEHQHYFDRLSMLEQKTYQCEELLKQSHQGQEDFIIQLQYRSKLHATVAFHEAQTPPDPCSIDKAIRDVHQYEELLKAKAMGLNKIRMNLLTQQREILTEMSGIQEKVINNHLPEWHLMQQFANNGADIEVASRLDRIQTWVEKLTNITWRIRNQLRGLHLLITSKQNVPFNLEELNRLGIDVNKSLETLILKTFVVEKQPPQVMKTNTRFTSTVRFLSGNVLNVSMINPTVRVTILSESNARLIIQRHREMIDSSWDFDRPSSTNALDGGVNASPDPRQVISPQASASNPTYSGLSPDSRHPSPTSSATSRPASTQHSSVNRGTPSPQQMQFNQQHYQQIPAPMASMAQHYMNINFEEKVLNMNEFEPSGEILNNSNNLEYQENSRQLLCHFRNMQLKKIKRTEKKGTESVMDEKFVLLFHCVFRIAAPFIDTSPYLAPQQKPFSSVTTQRAMFNQSDLTFHIMAFSLPVVVIVHGNQEPHAWATVTWHDAFARPDELLYRVPDKVPWKELGSVLSDKFRSFAGKGLSEQNLDYLASKICRNPVNSNEASVTWNQFAKELLPDRSFTFWEWFHSILKLTKEHLRELWQANRIYGFVGKKGCIELLLGGYQSFEPSLGTFLLRYSETELGGITIAWLCEQSKMSKNGYVQISKRHSPTNSSSNVLGHLQPFVSKDLNTRSLADRIRDLPDLVYLYPDIPKDDAFKDYYTPLNDTAPLSNGYIKPMLIQTLVTNYPKSSTAGSSIASESVAPTTPSSFFQSSPDGIYQENAFISDPNLFPDFQ